MRICGHALRPDANGALVCEHLTRGAADAARALPRDSDFYEEERLPAGERGSLRDYGRGAGLDRGTWHPAPTLATRRRRPRALGWQAFRTKSGKRIRPRSAPASRMNADFCAPAAAYIARNDAAPAYSVVSIAELVHFAGVDPFPSLPKSMRMSPMDLPPPMPASGRAASAGAFHSPGWPAPTRQRRCRLQTLYRSLSARPAPWSRWRQPTHDRPQLAFHSAPTFTVVG
ncbi:hypothetical protein D9M68_189020 [compost metagenome]